MPVVELSYSQMQKLVGKVSKKQISKSLPFLGLDIESEDGDLVRVEYSPNRPDYSTDYGISLGLQGLLGIKKGMVDLKTVPGKSSLYVTSKVAKVRPYVTGIIARGGAVNDRLIRQLMVMQEDLHFGMGRRRKKSSIGIHDLDKITFPLTYTTAKKSHKFVPLNSSKDLTASQILSDTYVGRDYGGILGNSTEVPVILDANNETVSLPPIINAAVTTLTEKTRNLFVEVTGISKHDIEDVLSVVALILQTAGFCLEEVNISGARNSTPKLAPRQMALDPGLVSQTLGLDLKPREIVLSLQKSRLAASLKGRSIACMIPPYRFDILGEMDLVEEAALGYGIENIGPTLSPSRTLGKASTVPTQTRTLSLLMVGLGYTEALNSSLTSRRILCEMTGRKGSKAISVMDSKSQEHTVLRDSILPELVENLSRNIHEQYPQRLFETGAVFQIGDPVDETSNLACVSAHKDASFTEAKSVLQSVLHTGFGIKVQTKPSSDPMFEKGRTAAIMAGTKQVGLIGEINPKTVASYKIRVPVVGFELSLSGLIFD